MRWNENWIFFTISVVLSWTYARSLTHLPAPLKNRRMFNEKRSNSKRHFPKSNSRRNIIGTWNHNGMWGMCAEVWLNLCNFVVSYYIIFMVTEYLRWRRAFSIVNTNNGTTDGDEENMKCKPEKQNIDDVFGFGFASFWFCLQNSLHRIEMQWNGICIPIHTYSFAHKRMKWSVGGRSRSEYRFHFETIINHEHKTVVAAQHNMPHSHFVNTAKVTFSWNVFVIYAYSFAGLETHSAT